MTVYVDELFWPWKGQLWCHMAADTLQELIGFAARIRMNPNWIQLPPKSRYPHFDLNGAKRAKAVGLGAVEIEMRQLLAHVKKLRYDFYTMEAGNTESALDRALRKRPQQLMEFYGRGL